MEILAYIFYFDANSLRISVFFDQSYPKSTILNERPKNTLKLQKFSTLKRFYLFGTQRRVQLIFGLFKIGYSISICIVAQISSNHLNQYKIYCCLFFYNFHTKFEPWCSYEIIYMKRKLFMLVQNIMYKTFCLSVCLFVFIVFISVLV